MRKITENSRYWRDAEAETKTDADADADAGGREMLFLSFFLSLLFLLNFVSSG